MNKFIPINWYHRRMVVRSWRCHNLCGNQLVWIICNVKASLVGWWLSSFQQAASENKYNNEAVHAILLHGTHFLNDLVDHKRK